MSKVSPAKGWEELKIKGLHINLSKGKIVRRFHYNKAIPTTGIITDVEKFEELLNRKVQKLLSRERKELIEEIFTIIEKQERKYLNLSYSTRKFLEIICEHISALQQETEKP